MYKIVLFGTKDILKKMEPLCKKEIDSGIFEIVGRAVFENRTINFIDGKNKLVKQDDDIINHVNLAICFSAKNEFYGRMRQLKGLGFPSDKIIDGRVFQIPNLDFPRLLSEGIAYGIFESKYSFFDRTNVIYPRVYTFRDSEIVVKLGVKSRIHALENFPTHVEGNSGMITFENFSSISWDGLFQVNPNIGHSSKFLTSFHPNNFDWNFPKKFRAHNGECQIKIGNDVWIGRGCALKCTNPEKPLIIGDGAVIASSSVVVKNVPPYAIVGGNPAQVIKYRFPPHVIEALLRIKWWDWSFDKIHRNFKYFNDVEKFISLHDK
ncbi:MAG: CatB-related O-acetyltransferase, partial [Selenomonadaceae bacterium]|nr:CatB-related O-acetyltransferase [Selenomonadaceae bacterium]